MGRARRLTGNALVIVFGAILAFSALAKFANVPAVVAPLAKIGFSGGRLMLIAFAELTSAVLFLIPRTRAIGLILISSYLGGAIAAHLGNGELIVKPAMFLILIWIATAVRNPQALWSFQ